MKNHIEIEFDVNDIPLLVKLYEAKKQDDINKWDAKIAGLLGLYGKPVANDSVSTGTTAVTEYPKGTWLERIKWIVANKGVATSASVLDTAIDYEPKYKENRKNLIPTVSSILRDNSIDPDGIFIREEIKGVFHYKLRK